MTYLDYVKVFSNQSLMSWLQTEVPLSTREHETLRDFQELLILNSDAWNEQELSLNFIGPVFALARFSDPYRYNLFSERKIGAVIPRGEDDIELSGEPDGIIATGYREPKIPMFAFSEYKRELDPTGDPVGQTLAAMLVGQALDERSKPTLWLLCGGPRLALSCAGRQTVHHKPRLFSDYKRNF